MLLRNILLVFGLVSCCLAVADDSRILEKEAIVRAPIADVWNAWTTAEGLSFISRKSNVELRIDGAYEWFLDGEADHKGHRGGEGSQILAYLPRKMIAFSWTFPPDIPELRDAGEMTQVVVLFDEVPDGGTRVRLSAHGWQDGDAWQHGWEYFDRAWSIVLAALKEHLEK
jgi:uncharacterized protein YndB with AHSA1/START domain